MGSLSLFRDGSRAILSVNVLPIYTNPGVEAALDGAGPRYVRSPFQMIA
jgi:hypothetical protein